MTYTDQDRARDNTHTDILRRLETNLKVANDALSNIATAISTINARTMIINDTTKDTQTKVNEIAANPGQPGPSPATPLTVTLSGTAVPQTEG